MGCTPRCSILSITIIALSTLTVSVTSQQDSCFEQRAAADPILGRCTESISISSEGMNMTENNLEAIERICSDECIPMVLSTFMDCGEDMQAEIVALSCGRDSQGRFCAAVLSDNSTSTQLVLDTCDNSTNCDNECRTTVEMGGCCTGNFFAILQTSLSLLFNTSVNESLRIGSDSVIDIGGCDVPLCSVPTPPFVSTTPDDRLPASNVCFVQRMEADSILAECARSLTDNNPDVVDMETTCSNICQDRLTNAITECQLPTTLDCNDQTALSSRALIIGVVTGVTCSAVFFTCGIVATIVIILFIRKHKTKTKLKKQTPAIDDIASYATSEDYEVMDGPPLYEDVWDAPATGSTVQLDNIEVHENVAYELVRK